MIGQLNDLYSLRCETCGGHHFEDLADNEDWDAIYRQIAEDLLSGADYKVNADLHLKTAEKLCKVIDSNIKPTREDELRLVAALKQNIYPFSAAKSFQQMLYYRKMMVDNGSVIGKDQFIKRIADTGEIFNKKFLSAEYENAAYSAIMADKWSRFSDDEYLQYSTVGDSNVRPSHAVLDKYTAPKTDVFWKKNYPPNGWGCRCTVVPGKANFQNALTSKEAGSQLKTENKDTPFYNNVGESKLIFDGKHPYFQEAGGKVRNLSWQEYGMPNLEKIYSEEKPTFSRTTKEEYQNWWKAQTKKSGDDIQVKDVLGNHITLPSGEGKPGKPSDYFKEHILKKSDENRHEFATKVKTILESPDEVWLNPQDKNTINYLKYYEGGIIRIIVKDNLEAETMFFIDKNGDSVLNKIGEARKGVLMYRK